MLELIMIAALFTGCATAQLSQDKREDMRHRLAHNTRCMDYEECDRPVKR